MEKTHLDNLLEEVCAELRGIGIPISEKLSPSVLINTRAKRRLGCCFFKDGRYIIEISRSILDKPELLRQTLAHELLHTCYGCNNHGSRWKSYAARLNETFGYSIERTSKPEGDLTRLRTEQIRYILECSSCGVKIYRSRLSKAVKAPWRYRCRCGGKLKRIQ